MRKIGHLWLFFSLLIISLVFLGPQPAGAQQLAPASITEFAVTTMDGKPVRDDLLMAGATYKINFTIQAASGIKEKCVLKTDLARANGLDHFWTLKGIYPGIDSTTWQPGQSTLTFIPAEGSAQLVLEGTVPEDFVLETLPDGTSLHLAKNITLLELSLESSGTVIANRQLEVIDSSIEEFRNVLSEKQGLLTTMTADPAYVDLARALVTSAETQAKLGQIDLATETLNALPESGWIKPQGSTFYQWIIAGVLGIIAAAAVFLLLKTRSEMGFLKSQADSQARNLQVLARKASRTGDSSLTAGIEQVRKELEQTLGGS